MLRFILAVMALVLGPSLVISAPAQARELTFAERYGARSPTPTKKPATCSLADIHLGMNMSAVQLSCWGRPYGTRSLTTSAGRTDVHTYFIRSSSGMRKTLIFTNGELTAIQDN
jgi:hypothetical protein